jgi:hypothetical protein
LPLHICWYTWWCHIGLWDFLSSFFLFIGQIVWIDLQVSLFFLLPAQICVESF